MPLVLRYSSQPHGLADFVRAKSCLFSAIKIESLRACTLLRLKRRPTPTITQRGRNEVMLLLLLLAVATFHAQRSTRSHNISIICNVRAVPASRASQRALSHRARARAPLPPYYYVYYYCESYTSHNIRTLYMSESTQFTAEEKHVHKIFRARPRGYPLGGSHSAWNSRNNIIIYYTLHARVCCVHVFGRDLAAVGSNVRACARVLTDLHRKFWRVYGCWRVRRRVMRNESASVLMTSVGLDWKDDVYVCVCGFLPEEVEEGRWMIHDIIWQGEAGLIWPKNFNVIWRASVAFNRMDT